MIKFLRDYWVPLVIVVQFILIVFYIAWVNSPVPRCQGAQKRVEDTFKVMDACQQMLGCTITVDDLRKAQEQLNQAESCK